MFKITTLFYSNKNKTKVKGLEKIKFISKTKKLIQFFFLQGGGGGGMKPNKQMLQPRNGSSSSILGRDD